MVLSCILTGSACEKITLLNHSKRNLNFNSFSAASKQPFLSSHAQPCWLLTITKRFGQMETCNMLCAVQIRNGACHAQHTVIAPCRKIHSIGSIPNKRSARRIKHSYGLKHITVRLGIGAQIRMTKFRKARQLNGPRFGHAHSHINTFFFRRRQG